MRSVKPHAGGESTRHMGCVRVRADCVSQAVTQRNLLNKPTRLRDHKPLGATHEQKLAVLQRDGAESDFSTSIIKDKLTLITSKIILCSYEWSSSESLFVSRTVEPGIIHTNDE